jgi:spore maturation protein CgeB
LTKINFYLDNEEERLRISTNGYEEYKKNYSSTVFWNTVLGSL